MGEHGFTPGNWRAVAMGGASTVLCHFRPRHNNTAAPTYGYREDGDYCIATPFKDDGGLVRPDFVSFSHDDARLIAASPTLLEALERLIHDVDDLMGHSEGVIGLHLNGDVAPWSELGEGGQSEPWLGEALSQARAAITLATGKDA